MEPTTETTIAIQVEAAEETAAATPSSADILADASKEAAIAIKVEAIEETAIAIQVTVEAIEEINSSHSVKWRQ